MHLAFVLTGLGTMLLGPILPLLSQRWHLDDAHTGLLLMAQFAGSFLGGITTSHRLRTGTLLGLAAGAIGFTLFALAPSLPLACIGLVIGGFGVGRVITTINITAGNRFTQNRGSALSRLNFTWSFGALLSPVLAAWLTPHFALSNLLLIFALCFLLLAILLLIELRNNFDLSFRTLSEAEGEESASPGPAQSLPTAIFLYFITLLFLYGGLETCLSAWLTTFALRFGVNSLALSEYTMVLLLSGLTAGRAIATWLLLRMRERTLQRIALILSALLAAALATSRHASVIATLAVLLGIALAPIFPATFALLMAHRPPARKAGVVMAVSGLGAAALPWLMGVISTHAGGLQVALIVPIAVAIVMLALSFLPASAESTHP